MILSCKQSNDLVRFMQFCRGWQEFGTPRSDDYLPQGVPRAPTSSNRDPEAFHNSLEKEVLDAPAPGHSAPVSPSEGAPEGMHQGFPS
jgi:hypothetical protein